MTNARITLANIVDRVHDTYNTNERWVVKKMRSKYANRIATILPIIYQRGKVQNFSNNSTKMISRADHEKYVESAAIMYSQLVKELVKWEKCQKKNDEGTTKRKPKKDVYHSAIVLEVMFQKWFPLEKTKPHEKKKHVEQP
jgi:hypothetical protein